MVANKLKKFTIIALLSYFLVNVFIVFYFVVIVPFILLNFLNENLSTVLAIIVSVELTVFTFILYFACFLIILIGYSLCVSIFCFSAFYSLRITFNDRQRSSLGKFIYLNCKGLCKCKKREEYELLSS